MPKKAKRPCRRCKVATSNSNGYCDDHQDSAVGWYQSNEGKTTSQRGYGYQWEKKKQRVIKRDRGLCMPHLRRGFPVPFAEVDHIRSKKNGGGNELSNLQCICTECHKEKTALERREGGYSNLKWPLIP